MCRGRFILALVLAAMGECAIALCGWRLPLLPLCVLYAGMARQMLRVLPECVLTAAMLDALWCHTLPAELLAVLAVAVLAASVSDYASPTSWIAMALSGATAGGLTAVVLCMARMTFHGSGTIVVSNLVGGTLLASPLAHLMDTLVSGHPEWKPVNGGFTSEDSE